MRAITFTIISLLIASSPLAAQPSGEFTFEVPFRWTEAEGDPIERQQNLGAGLSVEHLFAAERGRVFYDMEMDTFGADEALRTWLHNAGAMVTFGSEARALDLGGSFFWRANEGLWADAGFKGVNLLASGRLRPVTGLTLATSYALYARSFADQPALDQIEHYGAARLLANLQTRTTVAAVVTIGQKRYDGRELVVVLPEIPEVDLTLHGGRGWRQGLFVPSRIEEVGEAGTRHEWSWAARVAQSLDDRTGVWIEREERRTGGDLPPAIVWTPPLFYEDGVYDDPYVIEAKTWRAGAKHVFARGHEVSGWASYSDRSYAGLPREDTLTRAGVELLAPLVNGRSAALDLVGRYSFFRNSSSEPLEAYRAHQVSAGLRVAF